MLKCVSNETNCARICNLYNCKQYRFKSFNLKKMVFLLYFFSVSVESYYINTAWYLFIYFFLIIKNPIFSIVTDASSRFIYMYTYMYAIDYRLSNNFFLPPPTTPPLTRRFNTECNGFF